MERLGTFCAGPGLRILFAGASERGRAGALFAGGSVPGIPLKNFPPLKTLFAPSC